MNVNNITGGIKKHADKLGILAGLFYDGVNPVTNSLMKAARGNIHMPDLDKSVTDVMGSIQIPIGLWLASWLAGDINIPVVGKVGKSLEKAAQGFLVGKIALALLYNSTHSDGNPVDEATMYENVTGEYAY